MKYIVRALAVLLFATCAQAQQISGGGGGGGGAPSGPAGGVLGGTYPNPTFASTTGTGATVLANTPTLITPVLGVANGTSLALGGATLGSNALAVTGTSSFGNGTANINAVGAISAASGASGGFNIVGDANWGIYRRASSTITFFTSSSLSEINTTGFLSASTSLIQWNSTTIGSGAADTTLSRQGPGVIQFGTTTANAAGAWLAAKGTLTGGTLADQAQVLAITATQPASPTSAQRAITYTVTSAGSASQVNQAMFIGYNSGYTGSSVAAGLRVNTNIGGTASTMIPAAGGSEALGIFGIQGYSTASSAGLMVGVNGFAEFGSKNVGVLGLAQAVINSGTNIGVVGSAINTGTTPVQIGGFFSLNQTSVPSVSAALIADNGAQTDAIFLARDNGSTVFTIADGGTVTTTGTVQVGGSVRAGSTQLFFWDARSLLASASDGVISMQVNAGGDFNRLQFGGTTSSFPAIKRSTTVLQFKLADDSAFTSFTATTGILNALATDAGQTTATVCADNTTGQLYKGSGTVGICLGTSSARYKNRIVDAGEGLAEIIQLQPKRFWYNKDAGDNGAREQVGFLAEDVLKVLPGLVGLDASGRPNTLDLVGMIPTIVRSIQELKSDNDNLRETITRRAASGG